MAALGDSDAESGYGEDANATREEGPEINLSLEPDEASSMKLIDDVKPGPETAQQLLAPLVVQTTYTDIPFHVQWPYSQLMKVKRYEKNLAYICHYQVPRHMMDMGKTSQTVCPTLGTTTNDFEVITIESNQCVEAHGKDTVVGSQNEEDTTEKCNSSTDASNTETNARSDTSSLDVHTVESKEDANGRILVEHVELKCNEKSDDTDDDELHTAAAQPMELPREDSFDTVDRDFDCLWEDKVGGSLSTLSFSGPNSSTPSRDQFIDSIPSPFGNKPKDVQWYDHSNSTSPSVFDDNYTEPRVMNQREEDRLNNEITSRLMLYRDISAVQSGLESEGLVGLETEMEGKIDKSAENDNLLAPDTDPAEEVIALTNEFIPIGDLPQELQEDYWDVSLICLDDDEEKAKEFTGTLVRECRKNDDEREITVRLSCELFCQDIFDQLSVLLKRGSIIILYMTRKFIEDRLSKYKTHTALYASLTDKCRCGTLIPLYYETPRNDLNIPTELRVLTGTSWEKELQRNSLIKTCRDVTSETDRKMEDLENKREVAREEIRLKYDEQQKEANDRIKEIKLARVALLNEA